MHGGAAEIRKYSTCRLTPASALQGGASGCETAGGLSGHGAAAVVRVVSLFRSRFFHRIEGQFHDEPRAMFRQSQAFQPEGAAVVLGYDEV